MKRASFLAISFTVLWALCLPSARAELPCRRASCPDVSVGQGAVTASYVDGDKTASVRLASNLSPPVEKPYRWYLRTPCQVTDPTQGACVSGEYVCPAVDGRLIQFYLVLHRRIFLASGPVDQVPVP